MVATAPLEIPAIEPSARVRKFIQSPRQLLINGQWQDAASGKTFAVYNPASGEPIAQVAEGDAEDINRAVAAARAVFDDPGHAWNTMTPSERGRLIWRIGDLVLEHADELADRLQQHGAELAADALSLSGGVDSCRLSSVCGCFTYAMIRARSARACSSK